VYTAYTAARSFIKQHGSRPVPMRLRNSPTKLMKQLGYGEGYRYAHDEVDAYAAGEHYLPDDMPPVTFYDPTDRGAAMTAIQERLKKGEFLTGLLHVDASGGKEFHDVNETPAIPLNQIPHDRLSPGSAALAKVLARYR